jgi:hypothetical protein
LYEKKTHEFLYHKEMLGTSRTSTTQGTRKRVGITFEKNPPVSDKFRPHFDQMTKSKSSDGQGFQNLSSPNQKRKKNAPRLTNPFQKHLHDKSLPMMKENSYHRNNPNAETFFKFNTSFIDRFVDPQTVKAKTIRFANDPTQNPQLQIQNEDSQETHPEPSPQLLPQEIPSPQPSPMSLQLEVDKSNCED